MLISLSKSFSQTEKFSWTTLLTKTRTKSVISSAIGLCRPVRLYSAGAPATLRQLSESFLNGTNSFYVEQMYDAWKKNPSSVHVSWATFFTNIDSGAAPGEGWTMPPTLGKSPHFTSPPPAVFTTEATSAVGTLSKKVLEDHMKVQLLIRAYQVRGHELANIDPLQMKPIFRPLELQLETYGFKESDLDNEFFIDSCGVLSGVMSSSGPKKLREIIRVLEETYCGSIGCEYMHIQDREQSNWIRKRLELEQQPKFTKEERHEILDHLASATLFEQFLGIKWFGQKRFGLEGGESLIPGLIALINQSAKNGVEKIVIGMAHRGRLNVLGNVLKKPMAEIFHEFDDHGGTVPILEHAEWGASGDVKYHLGTSCTRDVGGGSGSVYISVLSNPSHLEAVNPVVEGKTRAKQYFNSDKDRSSTMSIQIHGDAANVGQGVVYETINMSGLEHYGTGGTIHVIINNQIGFTTDPCFARTGMYCTQPEIISGAPIFHVNSSDPEAVVRVMKLAADYRAKFHIDVCIDVVCYRLNGHNEGDEPFFTQPLMYNKIRSLKNSYDLYKELLIREGAVTEAEVKAIQDSYNAQLESQFKAAKDYVIQPRDWLESRWSGFKGPGQLARIKSTAISAETLREIGETLCHIPEGFNLHRVLKNGVKSRLKMFETGKKFDWATAEALAFGSLLLEANHVRLSGQDVQRGTFSHRNCVWVDQVTNETYIPLNNLEGAKESFHVVNSPLSEYGCLGFEVGYSLESPNQLVCWEAQFGDFSNGAQIPIDNFISCGEQKWFRQSGITLLLPHGNEGQGPEHSSARLERFLQLSDDDPDEVIMDKDELIQKSNWAVVNVSTPANYFHVLRQQIHREYRKPLIIMSPKFLLRYEACKSDLEGFTSSSSHTSNFRPVIPDVDTSLVPNDKVRRIIFCSGKVYYALDKSRSSLSLNDVAIIRVEQLAPFPFAEVIKQLELYSNAHVIWAQEEHKNMGAWVHVYFALKNCMKIVRGNDTDGPRYVGRPTSSSPAAGSKSINDLEHKKFIEDAFMLD